MDKRKRDKFYDVENRATMTNSTPIDTGIEWGWKYTYVHSYVAAMREGNEAGRKILSTKHTQHTMMLARLNFHMINHVMR